MQLIDDYLWEEITTGKNAIYHGDKVTYCSDNPCIVLYNVGSKINLTTNPFTTVDHKREIERIHKQSMSFFGREATPEEIAKYIDNTIRAIAILDYSEYVTKSYEKTIKDSLDDLTSFPIVEGKFEDLLRPTPQKLMGRLSIVSDEALIEDGFLPEEAALFSGRILKGEKPLQVDLPEFTHYRITTPLQEKELWQKHTDHLAKWNPFTGAWDQTTYHITFERVTQ